jgi:hypothetical protein
MADYEIKEGDWFAKIVKNKGLGYTWKKIYNNSDNQDFRKICPDPNLLIPGETCQLPEKSAKDVDKATESNWKFELGLDKAELHLVIIRPDGQPLKNKPYELVLKGSGMSDTTVKKSTDASGAIKCPITTQVEKGTLTIEGQCIDLLVGWLEPVTSSKGVQARLQNLNYEIPAIDGNDSAGTPTEAAILAFQVNHSIKGEDGQAGDKTKAKLKSVYGC